MMKNSFNKRDSQNIAAINKSYRETFPDNWLNTLQWSDEATSKVSYENGFKKIEKFEEDTVIALCKSLLSGEFVIRSLSNLQDLLTLCQDETSIDSDNNLQNGLRDRFNAFNLNLKESLRYYRLKFESLNDKMNLAENDYIINAISNKGINVKKSRYFQLLKLVMDVCFEEFRFSYDERYLQELILIKDLLSKYDNDTLKPIIDTTCLKVGFLLQKASHFSSSKKIQFFIDFKEQTIDSNINFENGRFDLYKRFEYFTYPDRIPLMEIRDWQRSCSMKNAKMWQMVMLMRYYTKESKSLQQIENLIKQYDSFYEKIKSHRYIDTYALKTTKNYMYNCRFSYLTKMPDFSYKEMQCRIKEIQTIQEETFIRNFHPYQKAVEYLISNIRKGLTDNLEIDELKKRSKLLSDEIDNYRDAYRWCRKNQFYPFQLLYNECLSPIKDMDVVLFTPSAFSRPIKYEKLERKLADYTFEKSAIEIEIKLYEEQFKMIDLKNSVEKNRKSYIEIFGVFTTVVTFLVGCITMFTNTETTKASLYDKIEHVSLLGIILLLFVNGGYFLFIDKPKGKSLFCSPKFWFFGITTILYLGILIKYLICS